MENIFEAVSKRDLNQTSVIATVIEGPAAGEKAFFNGSQTVWMTPRTSMISDYPEEIAATETGIVHTKEGYRIFCERIGQTKRLVICGAGHVSMPVIRLGRMIGFEVTVIDDRPKFADDARRAGADHVICEMFEKALKAVPANPDTYFVIVTRGHRYDTECLKVILKGSYAYLGMMGSKRRVAIVKEDLKREGYDADAVDGICAPIGLHIAAETPEEIAVSIMAEIIQVKNAAKSGDTYTKELLDCLTEKSGDTRKKVLATIISRKGSAPRSVGTKIVIFEDGQTLGTIGGGCVESDVIGRALLMMREASWEETSWEETSRQEASNVSEQMHEDDHAVVSCRQTVCGRIRENKKQETQENENRKQSCRLITVNMTQDQAVEAGMVCGGTVEIFLESV